MTRFCHVSSGTLGSLIAKGVEQLLQCLASAQTFDWPLLHAVRLGMAMALTESLGVKFGKV